MLKHTVFPIHLCFIVAKNSLMMTFYRMIVVTIELVSKDIAKRGKTVLLQERQGYMNVKQLHPQRACNLFYNHIQSSSIIFRQILDEEFVFSTSGSVCLQHNELPVAPLALSPGTLPSADPDCSSLTRTLLHLREKMTRNTIQPIGWQLQPRRMP